MEERSRLFLQMFISPWTDLSRIFAENAHHFKKKEKKNWKSSFAVCTKWHFYFSIVHKRCKRQSRCGILKSIFPFLRTYSKGIVRKVFKVKDLPYSGLFFDPSDFLIEIAILLKEILPLKSLFGLRLPISPTLRLNGRCNWQDDLSEGEEKSLDYHSHPPSPNFWEPPTLLGGTDSEIGKQGWMNKVSTTEYPTSGQFIFALGYT